MDRNNLAELYTQSFRENWDLPVFSDYEGAEFRYRDVAQSIQTLMIMFNKAGLRKGEKVAIYGRNSANWGKVFLACMAYGAVAVPILPDFVPENVHHIVNHSGSLFLFAAKPLWVTLDPQKMKNLRGCIAIEDFSILNCPNDDLKKYSEEGLKMMQEEVVKKQDFAFTVTPSDELQILSYTSGSSGFSKGVMIPVRSVFSNVLFAQDNMPLKSGDKIVSFLPMAHVFGLLFEFLFPVTVGCHITFLNKMPSPPVLIKSFQDIKPHLILSVPLVIEKIYKKRLLPTLQKPIMKVLLSIPLINGILHKKIRAKLVDTFGGRFHEIVIGGAALSSEVENFFRKIKFPFTIGYGMTECGPLISYAAWDVTQPFSAGKLVERMEVRIDSDDPYHTVGEIQVRGENVMLGYYNNDEANRNAFTDDGWLRTGDLGVIDRENFIYIKGRSKNMLLGPSGQNIYPEELEARLCNMPYILECVVVQRDSKLVALVYPDKEALKANHLDENALDVIMTENRKNFNHTVAVFEQLSRVEIVNEEFEKTPKKNIKRFLYT
ncbi:MAG TPA: AMP-binding protein [Prolixibacteraceae bacterium]|nr:AMP-binding protein [Prolixibacteraceae bacterium]